VRFIDESGLEVEWLTPEEDERENRFFEAVKNNSFKVISVEQWLAEIDEKLN
jgi:hypothetical protein